MCWRPVFFALLTFMPMKRCQFVQFLGYSQSGIVYDSYFFVNYLVNCALFEKKGL